MSPAGPPRKGLPVYRTRESKRAKRVLLHVLPEGTLEVVVPTGFSPMRVPEIVAQHEAWIRRTMEHLERRDAAAGNGGLPETVELRAAGRRVSIIYEFSSLSGLRLTQTAPSLIQIEGNTGDVVGCRTLLRRWLRLEARSFLVPWLDDLSTRFGLPYSRAHIRCQRTRWASCSSRGTISLNEKLLFLPADFSRYVLIHELCHTVHLSHSPEFWGLVGRLEPDYAAVNAAMRRANQFVPDWAG